MVVVAAMTVLPSYISIMQRATHIIMMHTISGDKVSFPHIQALHERPTMDQLYFLERRDGGNPIWIIERIGTKIPHVGRYLLQDYVVCEIEKNAAGNIELWNQEIFRTWLSEKKGYSDGPVTWKTLVNVLQDVKLYSLADEIVDALHSRHFKRYTPRDN